MHHLTVAERQELHALMAFCQLRNGVGESYQYVLVRTELLIKLAELAVVGSLVSPEKDKEHG